MLFFTANKLSQRKSLTKQKSSQLTDSCKSTDSYHPIMYRQSQSTGVPATDIAIVKDLNQSCTGTVNRGKPSKELFAVGRRLGAGSDGEVVQWTHLSTKTKIAVKNSHRDDTHTGRIIVEEIYNLLILGTHDHIVHMVAYNESSLRPQLFLELCDLGCLHDYRDNWCAQEKANGRPHYPSDMTIWKLLKDVSLALDFIHNKHQICYVHNDLKPDNILVTSPHGWHPEDGIPVEPVFKVADFARLMAYPTPPDCDPQEYCGTSEYAPPIVERNTPVHPAVDVWGLGASIQTFKTGLASTQSRQSYIRNMAAQGKPHPNLYDNNGAWHTAIVRWQRRVIYRPLSVSAATLREYHDLAEMEDDYIPSSMSLEYVYQLLWRLPASERVTSAALVRYVVTRADREVAILKAQLQAEKFLETACKLREKVTTRQAQRLMYPDE
ncbi:hypothetical protein J1614_004483 [Plenodomus biglobosus]|nr:hypothetical protein J1614_004483 [Plenodomus biglobosus]